MSLFLFVVVPILLYCVYEKILELIARRETKFWKNELIKSTESLREKQPKVTQQIKRSPGNCKACFVCRKIYWNEDADAYKNNVCAECTASLSDIDFSTADFKNRIGTCPLDEPYYNSFQQYQRSKKFDRWLNDVALLEKELIKKYAKK